MQRVMSDSIMTFLYGRLLVWLDRHLFHAQASSSRQARVPSDHYAVGTDKDRVRPPEFDDAGGNLSHLFVRVRPGVPGIRDQLVDGPNLYGEVAKARRC